MKNLTKKERQAIKELVEGLKKLCGNNLTRIILYGSKARGDSTEDSDIDIMIVLKEIKNKREEKEKISNFCWEICYKYDLLIAETIKTEQEYENSITPLLLNVRKEGIVL